MSNIDAIEKKSVCVDDKEKTLDLPCRIRALAGASSVSIVARRAAVAALDDGRDPEAMERTLHCSVAHRFFFRFFVCGERKNFSSFLFFLLLLLRSCHKKKARSRGKEVERGATHFSLSASLSRAHSSLLDL